LLSKQAAKRGEANRQADYFAPMFCLCTYFYATTNNTASVGRKTLFKTKQHDIVLEVTRKDSLSLAFNVACPAEA
jgi:hypothetical protein